ncbi:hypothetical protein EDL45_12135, partial [Salmonella enterica subsp. enterica]|nr:hypothetical protein [Salmonella enterica subsp. enterica serovar Chester]
LTGASEKPPAMPEDIYFVCYLWLSVGRIRRLRRHPTLLQPMMALRLSGQQTPYIPRIKKAAFAALK